MIEKGAVLGIGNVLQRDDGIGIKVLNFIDSQYCFPENVELVDGGTCGATLNSSIIGRKWLILLDALDVQGDPGEIRTLSGKDFINRPAQIKMSPHQVGFLDLIQMMRLEGTGPEDLDLIGVIPKDTSNGITISAEVEQAMDGIIVRLFALLAEKGIVPVKREPALKPDYWWLEK